MLLLLELRDPTSSDGSLIRDTIHHVFLRAHFTKVSMYQIQNIFCGLGMDGEELLCHFLQLWYVNNTSKEGAKECIIL